MTHSPKSSNSEELLWRAKDLMGWDESLNRAPTLLEYLRYYRSGQIGEIHIEAAITAHHNQLRQSAIDKLKKELG